MSFLAEKSELNLHMEERDHVEKKANPSKLARRTLLASFAIKRATGLMNVRKAMAQTLDKESVFFVEVLATKWKIAQRKEVFLALDLVPLEVAAEVDQRREKEADLEVIVIAEATVEIGERTNLEIDQRREIDLEIVLETETIEMVLQIEGDVIENREVNQDLQEKKV